MAIKKELESTYGIKKCYHRVTCISINALIKEVTICVSSYISKDTRDNGCDPLDSVDISIPRCDYDLFMKGDIFVNAYNF